MRVIYKYPVQIDDEFQITMPQYSEMLAVQIHEGKPYLWVLVDPTQECVPHIFYLAGTGHIRSKENLNKESYIGSFFLNRFIFHLFGGKEKVK